ncbi:MAG TPA: hypothetical protein PLF27_10280 [Sedimentibacter sp.]|nr:hypothetical protein [Sedimentibacter sp.]
MTKETTRNKTLQMRVNDEEYKKIEEKANSIGLSISNYMRMVCLNCKIDISFRPQKDD